MQMQTKSLIRLREKAEKLSLGEYNQKELRKWLRFRKRWAEDLYEKRFKITDAVILIRKKLVEEKKAPLPLVKLIVSSKAIKQDFLEAKLKRKLRYQFQNKEEYVRETLALLDNVIQQAFTSGDLGTVLESEKLRAKVLGLLSDKVGILVPVNMEEEIKKMKDEYNIYRRGLNSDFKERIEKQKLKT